MNFLGDLDLRRDLDLQAGTEKRSVRAGHSQSQGPSLQSNKGAQSRRKLSSEEPNTFSLTGFLQWCCHRDHCRTKWSLVATQARRKNFGGIRVFLMICCKIFPPPRNPSSVVKLFWPLDLGSGSHCVRSILKHKASSGVGVWTHRPCGITRKPTRNPHAVCRPKPG